MNLFATSSQVVRTTALVMIFAILLTPRLLASSPGDERATASVVGEVFMDSNLDTMREPLESGIQGSRVFLRDANEDILAETVTDSEGYYAFTNLDFATYQLQIFPPAGYIVSSNGSIFIQVGEVSPPVIFSTSVRFGVLIPFVSRYIFVKSLFNNLFLCPLW